MNASLSTRHSSQTSQEQQAQNAAMRKMKWVIRVSDIGVSGRKIRVGDF